MVSVIAAMDEKRGIGLNGKIPWHISEDFKRLKKITLGHPIVMGRKTFESIGKPLPDRTNIVITRDEKEFLLSHPEFISGSKMLKQVQHDKTSIVVNSIEEGIETARKSPGSEEIFIFGGGQIFKEAMEKDLVDKLYLTIVQGDFGADTFFPDYSEFKKVHEEEHDNGKYKFKFVDLVK